MENLISTTDFNIQQFELLFTDQIKESTYIDRVVTFAKTQKRNIKKNMFVPCLPNGDIFQTPAYCDKSCSPIDYCVGGKCDVEGCYGNVGRYEEACKTVLFNGWHSFDNSLSKIETGIANEVTNGEFTIYFYEDKYPFFVKNNHGFIGGFRIETIEDLLKAQIKFELTDNFKKQIRL